MVCAGASARRLEEVWGNPVICSVSFGSATGGIAVHAAVPAVSGSAKQPHTKSFELSYNVANGSCIALAAKPISRPNVITLNHNTSDSVPASLAEAGGDLPMSQSATVLIV
jgi:hypothetical protein